MDAGADSPRAARRVCYRCHKPALTCICATVQKVQNRTLVWIAQHPRERFHPIGTARIARLGLARMHMEVCFERGAEPPPSLPAGAALLYPTEDAPLVSELAPAERPSTLVVIDGTWAHAHTLFRDCAWLQALPRVRLAPTEPGNYRIRKEPAQECLSTIEAIVQALRALEPDTAGLEGLIGAFDGMIDTQIAHAEQHRAGPRRKRTRKLRSVVPRGITEHPERLVLVYGESSRMPVRWNGDGRELVQWAALRPATGEVFSRLLMPSGEGPTARHLGHMGLADAWRDDEKVDLEGLARAWDAFCGPRDSIAAWNKSTLDLMDHRPGLRGERDTHMLKSIYCRWRQRETGTLESVLEREEVEATPAPVAGRASERLGNARALFELLLNRATKR